MMFYHVVAYMWAGAQKTPVTKLHKPLSTDQHVHLHRLRCPRKESLGPWLSVERKTQTDHTVRIRKLILVFAEHSM